MGDRMMPNRIVTAVSLFVVLAMLVSTVSSSHLRGRFSENDAEDEGKYHVSRISSPFTLLRRFRAFMLTKPAMTRENHGFIEQDSAKKSSGKTSKLRVRREEKSEQDRDSEEYERRLFESLHIIGYIQPTRLYVPEDPILVPVGTVVGKVRKLHPHGKVVVVWPYKEFRNFTVDAITGEVKTTDEMDFELIRSYNMTIRDFEFDYTDEEPRKQPPKPFPKESKYVDHYLIVEVVDINDNKPIFQRDTGTGSSNDFSGRVNQNARAGTPILRIHPTDDDSGPRGRIRFSIVTEGDEETPFTIDPQTHWLKTNGKPLQPKQYTVQVKALDYGMPPKTSDTQVRVTVENSLPEFVGRPYNLNFSEASVRGSVVAKVTALSRSGIPMSYQILNDEAKKTFAINHLGEITLLRELDFETANETDKVFEFDVKAKEDADEGKSETVKVTLNLVNADDHLGIFKTPATKIRLKEGSAAKGGDVFNVKVEDCDCVKNCQCGSNEMIFTLGDTNGFFDITKDGQIQNIKDLDYEVKNYFFFPVNVTDPGTNGRTRTSYIEVYVEDEDDTPPKFPKTTYEFFIFEDAPKGQVVGVAQAVDPDPSTEPYDIQYSIHRGSSEARKYFAVGNQGVIIVNQNRDQFRTQDKYELEIKATDTEGHESVPHATVTIRILDVNDHQPVFKDCKSVTVKEGLPAGTKITTLTATDQDRGLNKLIEYGIQKVQKHNFFAINNETGVVTTTAVLDREEYENVFVIAKATDGGSQRSDALRQIGYCQFIVNVEDVNDNLPQFTVAKFDVTIKENLGVGQSVLLVEAVDPDLGENAKIKYKIDSQTGGNYFQVDETSGSLTVKNSLSTLALQDKVVIVIRAYNKGKENEVNDQSKTTVTVSFTNQNVPVFAQKKFVGNEVPENIAVGNSVLQLSVTSTGTTLYALQDEIRDRDNLPFTIDSSTGEIRTTKTLDYERKKSYLFAVTASSLNGQLSSAIVEIKIKDIDDVVPIFGNDRYEATVSEAAKPNTNVFRIKATDPDPSGGGPVSYRLQDKFDASDFQITELQDYAQIKTASNLRDGYFDRESKDVYNIIVEAYRGNDDKLKSTASVIINVRDENDSPPSFKKKLYEASIPENTATPYKVPGIEVRATDRDILENANVSYFITSGNDGRFEMRTVYGKNFNNSGELYIVSPLDVEKSQEFKKNPVYTLTVTATDRKHTDNATIIIKVLDQPETRPEFVQDYYEKFLPENVGPGVKVVQVQVKKAINVEFSLDNKAKAYFAIDKKTGWITTDGELLNWEETPVITFPVYAIEKSNPTEKGQTFVRVRVNDINDASPIFPDQPYIGYVKENEKPGAPVRYINGKDLDNPDVNSGNNVKLTYELLTNTGQDPYDRDGRLFAFNSEGLLVTKVTFNLEEYRRNLTLRVRAWDNGNPRLYGETDVTIVIRDVNEFPALFRKPHYDATVSETQPPGFVVLQLTIKDRDFAPRDNYAFSMRKGNVPYAFDILQDTGEIVVAGVLDYEVTKTREYNLEVGLAERSGEFMVPGEGINISVPYQDIATVKIKVTEGNDNRPTFTETPKIYTTVVSEDIKVGTNLNITLEASDEDVGYSSKFKFVITKGNFGDWFGIRQVKDNKAAVFIQNPLDREYQSVYNMEVKAIDDGGVYDTAILRVTATDVNDNAPVFEQSYYKVRIKENEDCGNNRPLATLIVTDPDRPEQGPFTFGFTSNGNPGNYFELRDGTDNSTTLYCIKSVNREVTPNLKLIIQATDSPPPKLSSTAIVFVDVEDVNEFTAKNGRMNIVVNAIKGKFGGGPVGKTYFEDDDGDGDSKLEYTLVGSEEFIVGRRDGMITAKSTVKVGKYKLRVTGSGNSGGTNPTCEVDVDVREIPVEAINNSAAIQLDDIWNEDMFLNPVQIPNTQSFESTTYYDKFVKVLSDLFGVSEENVLVFSIQMSTKVMPGRSIPSVDVLFAIRKDSSAKSDFLPRSVLVNTLEKNNATLVETFKEVDKQGFKLGVIGVDYCANESMRTGMCQNVIASKDSYTVVSSDYGLMPAPNFAMTFVSIDATVDGVYARYKQIPDPEYDKCEPEPCLNGGTCHEVLPHGFVCECPGEYSGPRCQMTTRTFLGDSYIWLHPKTPHNYGSISLEFATEEANGLLLYQGPAVKGGNNGHRDFLAISLVDGKVRVALSFGGKPHMFDMLKGPLLNDKKWHHVKVSHERKEVTVLIDHCKYADIVMDDERIVEKRENCELIAKTTGNYEYLNGLGPVQVGGIENMPLEYPSPEMVNYKSFRGCIRKITENLEMYDLAYPVKVVNAPAGCTIMAKCPDCMNGGYCYPGFARSVCTCPMGYVGDDCSGNAPRYHYLANSFTEYVLPGEERRRKRATANEPTDLLDRFSVHIAMQLRVQPDAEKMVFFYSASQDEMEYSILGYEEQKLYFEFKLLDALTRLEMPFEVNIADNEWHNVTVTREGNFAVLQVDYAGRVSRNTGGEKRLIRMASGKLYAGGVPNIAPNHTIVNKVVRTDVTDIRFRRRRSAGTILGVTTDGRDVNAISGDMKGCTGGNTYNGKNLDTDPNVKKIRFNIESGCPCRQVLLCRNGGVCVSAPVPYCQCTRGWTGRTCEDVVSVPRVLGFRVDGRARWQDGGVLIVILVVVLSVLVLAVALLFVKKRREAPYSVPVGDEGQDSIMPYHDDGAGEEDTFNYDIHHLMKYTYRDGHGTVTKSVNGKEIAPEHMELLNQAPDGSFAMTTKHTVRESVDVWPFILERIRKADEDISWWPKDEMRHWSDEGDDDEAGDLSEIGESDDEGEDVEQDWDFLKDWGRKFENLNKIFNPDDDDEADA